MTTMKDLLCCNRNKVDDDKTTVVVTPGKDTVFIFVSSNVMCRMLLGPFIQCLEKKALVSAKIELKSADPAKFPKSAVFKSHEKKDKFNPLGVFMLWSGENAFGKVSEVVHRFGNQHSISRREPDYMDILYTRSSADTKKEVDLWFERDPLPPVKAPATAEAAAAPTDDAAADPTAATTAPNESPPTHPEEPVPTYEDNATAEAEAPNNEEPPAPAHEAK